MIRLILGNEWRQRLFTAPWWLLAAASWLICAWLLFAQLQVYQQIQPRLAASGSLLGVNDLLIAPTLNTLSLLVLLIAPVLGMNALSEERRSGRLPLLLAGPLSPVQLLLGKWLGILLPLLLIVLGIFAMLASLATGMHLDWPRRRGVSAPSRAGRPPRPGPRARPGGSDSPPRSGPAGAPGAPKGPTGARDPAARCS